MLATGSRSFIPPMTGVRASDGGLLPGVYGFRTIDETRAMLEATQRCTRAVVMGGGLLGLEAAELNDLVDMMRHLRNNETRLHVRSEVPFYTGRRLETAEIAEVLA